MGCYGFLMGIDDDSNSIGFNGDRLVIYDDDWRKPLYPYAMFDLFNRKLMQILGTKLHSSSEHAMFESGFAVFF